MKRPPPSGNDKYQRVQDGTVEVLKKFLAQREGTIVMRLEQLEPQFIRHERSGDGHTYHHHIDSIEQAQGVIFLCPDCFKRNGGPVGTHSIICWSSSRGVPDFVDPKPGRWTLEGTSLDDLTLGAEPGKSRSVQLIGGCAAHFFVTEGNITW